MVLKSEIVRTPIKLRKPIYLDYCACWGYQVFSIEGVPQYLIADKMSNEEMIDFLSNTPVCLPIHFTEYNPKHDIKIGLALSRNIPVRLTTNKVLPDWILEEMRKVPHSGIQVSINFLSSFMRNLLEEDASDIKPLREMLSLAKSWKIFTSLRISYRPYLMSKLDLFEIIDSIKNYISHIHLTFPTVDDTYYYEHKHEWELINPRAVEHFKKNYTAYVPTRGWVVKSTVIDDISSELYEFIKLRKITMEIVEESYHDKRIRHINKGFSKLPLGIRPFFYEASNDTFVKVDSIEGKACSKCGKLIFA